MTAISGETHFVAMLGDPIVQVKTPAAFNAWAAEREQDVVMIPMQVAPEDLPATLSALRGWRNCCGAVVTYPHKQAVAQALDVATPAVQLVGACNVVRRLADGRLSGTMTDGMGFVRALSQTGLDPRGRDVRLIGAGGAGSAIALALLEAGAARLVVTDRDAARAEDLARRLRASFAERVVATVPPADLRCALVCNATPAGMSGDTAHPFPLDGLPSDCVVADIVPDPPMTPWLRAAAGRGHRVQTGPQMVRAQLPEILSFLDLR